MTMTASALSRPVPNPTYNPLLIDRLATTVGVSGEQSGPFIALFLQTWPTPVIIDEIQYAPQLFSAIKLQVDREKTNDRLNRQRSA